MSEHEMLAVYFTPDAIRDHFEGDHGDERAVWASVVATDDELRAIGLFCIHSDALWKTFHNLLVSAVEEEMSR